MSAKTALLKRADSVFGPLMCRILSRRQTSPEKRTLADFPGGRILVVRPGGIGDAILLLPFLFALRNAFPASSIDVLCEARNAALFKMCGLVEEILLYDKNPIGVFRALRSRSWVAVADTEQFHHFSAVFAALSKAPLRVGFSVNARRLGIYTHVVNYSLSGREEEQFGAILDALAGKTLPRASLFGILPLDILPPAPAGLPLKYIVVHAGASIPEKRWPAKRFASLCDSIRQYFGAECVIVGGAEDVRFATEILTEIKACNPVDFTGKTTLPQTATICAGAIASVCPDSAVAHLSCAVGVPTVVLFGPSDERKWGPPPEAGVALASRVHCRPCSMFGNVKPCQNPACILEVTESAVIEALERLLKRFNSLNLSHNVLGKPQTSLQTKV